MRLLRLFIAFVLTLAISPLNDLCAQEIKVKGCSLLQSDNTAKTNARYDINNDMCALIKVVTNDIEGLVFNNTNQYVGNVSYDKGVYYVYISPGMYKISFSHPSYQPGEINLANFGFKKKTLSGNTYQVELEAPKLLGNLKTVAFKVSPIVPNSVVIFEGNKKTIEGSGLVEFSCEEGSYDYRIQADNYETVFGNITVGDKNVEPIAVTLQPIRESVNISCNVSDAEVVVDNVNYGVVGLKKIPRGKHNIRIIATGYFDVQDSIDVQNGNMSLNYKMTKNKNKIINVHAVEIKVYCASTSLYRNNMKIPGWSSGKSIKMMPNTECKLSDDNGKGAILKVGNKPMTIRLSDGVITYLNDDVKKENVEKQKQTTYVQPQKVNKSGISIVHNIVDEMPSFPNGQSALFDYLAKNLKYPAVAEENGVQGRVLIKFLVKKDGSIANPIVEKSVDPSLDKEALRLVNAMPRWNPGKKNGVSVNVEFSLPITFRLQ